MLLNLTNLTNLTIVCLSKLTIDRRPLSSFLFLTMMKITVLAFTIAASTVAAFVLPPTYSRVSVDGKQATALFGWLDESLFNQVGKFLDDLAGLGSAADEESQIEPQNSLQTQDEESKKKNTRRVIRTAARAYDKDASTPSSRAYTTRKNSVPNVAISASGVVGDYNHYRSAALSSTPDRAVSLLTTDAMSFLQSLHPSSQQGDLGENLLIDGVTYRDFVVGSKVMIGDAVIVEITEPIEPCANLCKLPYINDDKLNPKQRIELCRTFIEKLDTVDGLRGWYAKVLQPGKIYVGAMVQLA